MTCFRSPSYALADWIVDGEPPFDLWEVDVARADPRTAEPEHMAQRMQEAVADLFTMHWPYKQPQAGRGLRRSFLHDHWAEQGAHFGLTAGWERADWFAPKGVEPVHKYDWEKPNWFDYQGQEHMTVREAVGLYDLTSMGKLLVQGPDAEGFLRIHGLPSRVQGTVTPRDY